MSAAESTFGSRLQTAVAARGPLLAGVDPHASLLEQWDLPDTPGGLAEFSRGVLEAVDGEVAAIKPQSAFYERHGSRGMAVLEALLAGARERGILTILDVKRRTRSPRARTSAPPRSTPRSTSRSSTARACSSSPSPRTRAVRRCSPPSALTARRWR